MTLRPHILFFLSVIWVLNACKKDDPASEAGAQLNFQFKFDANQQRLNNIGQPAVIPAGHATQTPDFKTLSIHYIELAPNALTLLGKGAIVYQAEETTLGGEKAVDFDKAVKSGPGQVFHKLKLKDIPPGTYEWIRTSVTYQNYDIRFNIHNIPVIGSLTNQKGTVASFLGFNTYIRDVKPREKILTVNDDKKQGFWAFETALEAPLDAYNQIFSGEAPAGSTTVVNPLFATSPVPAGSCVITGKLATPLVVTGKETQDITITLSYSVRESLEWEDTNANGQLDFYGSSSNPPEKIVDMGLRGLIPDWK